MSPAGGPPCLPTKKDVLFGRDTASWINGGNRLLRRMIEKHHEAYTPTMTRAEMRKLTATIVNDLKSSGARFLKLDHSTRQYSEVDDKICFHKVGRTIRDQHVTYQRRKERRKMAEDAYTQKVVVNASNVSRAASQSMTKVASTDLAAKRMKPSEFASMNDTQVVVNPLFLPEERETAAAMFEIVRRSVLDRNATSGQPARRHEKQIDTGAALSGPTTPTSRDVNAARNRIPHSQLDHQRLSEVSEKLLAATREKYQIECELATRRQLRLRALNLLVSEGLGHQDFNPYGSQSEFPMLGLYCDRILTGVRGPLSTHRELLPSTHLLRLPTTIPPIEPTFCLPDFS